MKIKWFSLLKSIYQSIKIEFHSNPHDLYSFWIHPIDDHHFSAIDIQMHTLIWFQLKFFNKNSINLLWHNTFEDNQWTTANNIPIKVNCIAIYQSIKLFYGCLKTILVIADTSFPQWWENKYKKTHAESE